VSSEARLLFISMNSHSAQDAYVALPFTWTVHVRRLYAAIYTYKYVGIWYASMHPRAYEYDMMFYTYDNHSPTKRTDGRTTYTSAYVYGSPVQSSSAMVRCHNGHRPSCPVAYVAATFAESRSTMA
jgi:hypothetical protein